MTRLFIVLFTVTLFVFSARTLVGQDDAAAADDSGGRLPAHYRDIVNDAQRDAIYEIQNKYEEMIKPLEEKVKQLKAEEKKEIEAVLTPKQLLVLKKLEQYYKDEAERRKKFIEGILNEAEKAKE